MAKRAVILLTGNPRAEEMRKGLPPRFLSVLHRDLAMSIRALTDTELIIASDSSRGFHLDAGRFSHLERCNDLADRVGTSLDFADSLGFEHVILVAGDVAGIETAVFEDAFTQLERSTDCVLAASSDGGFSILGLRADARLDWQSIPWFSREAERGLLKALSQAGLSWIELAPVDDIDDRSTAMRVLQDRSLHRHLRSLLLSLLASKAPLAHLRTLEGFPSPAAIPHLRAPPVHAA